MKLLFFIILSLTISSCIEEEIELPLENDIFILTTSTFDKTIKKYENILIMFYSPKCGICEKFKPIIEKVASIFHKENLDLIVAKVDSTKEKKLSKKYKIKSYPTLKFFKKGVPIDYTGERKEKDIIKWARKMSRQPTKPLNTIEQVERFQKYNQVCIIYFGKDPEEINIFEGVALENEDFPFGIVEDEEISKKFNAKLNSIVLFKQFDEKRNDLEIIREKEIIDFIEKYSQKRILSFDSKITKKVFGENHPAVVYFGEIGEKWNETEKIMEKIYDKYKDKLLFIMTEINDGIGKRVAKHVGIKKEELPSIRILDTRNDIKRYIMEGIINEKNILNFIEDWQKGKLKRHLKSQEEPKENNENVFIIVGKSFQKEVIENDKDVMIVFYAPWCKHSKKFLSIYEEIVKKLKEKNPKIMFAKMDATENEIESENILEYPTIKFYPGNKKNLPPIDYEDERTIEDIINFIKDNAYNKVIFDEEKKEDKSTEL